MSGEPRQGIETKHLLKSNKKKQSAKNSDESESGGGSEWNKRRSVGQIAENPISWIALGTLLGYISLIIIILFLVFELIGNNPVFVNSKSWMIIIGFFGSWFFMLMISSIIVLNIIDVEKQNRLRVFQLKRYIKLQLLVSFNLLLLFSLANYTWNLDPVVNLVEYNSNRNLISVWFIFTIISCTGNLYDVIFFQSVVLKENIV